MNGNGCGNWPLVIHSGFASIDLKSQLKARLNSSNSGATFKLCDLREGWRGKSRMGGVAPSPFLLPFLKRQNRRLACSTSFFLHQILFEACLFQKCLGSADSLSPLIWVGLLLSIPWLLYSCAQNGRQKTSLSRNEVS